MSQAQPVDRLLDQPVSALGDISTRAHNALKDARIVTVRQLVETTERDLMRLPKFGRVSLEDLIQLLADHGLTLKAEEHPKNQPDLPFPSLFVRINQLEQRIAAIERKLVHVTER